MLRFETTTCRGSHSAIHGLSSSPFIFLGSTESTVLMPSQLMNPMLQGDGVTIAQGMMLTLHILNFSFFWPEWTTKYLILEGNKNLTTSKSNLYVASPSLRISQIPIPYLCWEKSRLPPHQTIIPLIGPGTCENESQKSQGHSFVGRLRHNRLLCVQ